MANKVEKIRGCNHKGKKEAEVILFSGGTYKIKLCQACVDRIIESDASLKKDVAGIIL